MVHESVVRGLYRLQQRMGMTAPEFRAVSAFAGLLLLGAVAEHAWTRAAPVDPLVYAETEAYFRERAAMAGLLGSGHEASSAADTSEGPDDPPPPEPPAGPPPPTASPGPLDVNAADAVALQALPGIGPALASRIVAFRERNGPFLFMEDLLMVRGIGEKTLHRLAPLVTVDGVPTPDSSGSGP